VEFIAQVLQLIHARRKPELCSPTTRTAFASLAGAGLLTPDDADFVFSRRLDAPPAVVWEYWVDPEMQLRWGELTGVGFTPNERGRSGAGATMHCAHGSWSSLMRYVDWRPVRYYTAERLPTSGMMAAPPMTERGVFSAPGTMGMCESSSRLYQTGRLRL